MQDIRMIQVNAMSDGGDTKQLNIATKLNKIDVGYGSPDDCITETASSKIGKCDRS